MERSARAMVWEPVSPFNDREAEAIRPRTGLPSRTDTLHRKRGPSRCVQRQRGQGWVSGRRKENQKQNARQDRNQNKSKAKTKSDRSKLNRKKKQKKRQGSYILIPVNKRTKEKESHEERSLNRRTVPTRGKKPNRKPKTN